MKGPWRLGQRTSSKRGELKSEASVLRAAAGSLLEEHPRRNDWIERMKGCRPYARLREQHLL